ncbi:hypothetical protein HYFRA_00009586 [Hymenoscyphus fraxineus]|uniref:Uncharacterized protein n=1 Tax=Hymenoscyphus fraxineus TaxID=746836 RepID=A0A9N9L223_9HELO|nr:hypothetical protein HYFRA_00009586 [Hymenoscyphus fraxineus]
MVGLAYFFIGQFQQMQHGKFEQHLHALDYGAQIRGQDKVPKLDWDCFDHTEVTEVERLELPIAIYVPHGTESGVKMQRYGPMERSEGATRGKESSRLGTNASMLCI